MPLKNGLPTQHELMRIPESDLFTKIDETMGGTGSEWRFMLAQLYRDELVRRRQDATNKNMWRLTIAIAVLALFNVLAVIWMH